MSWPRAALLSLSDKSGAVEFARALSERNTRILASGGTAGHLERAGVPVTTVEAWTGFPELLGGRVKTLHPHVHGPILARRDEPDDLRALAERGVEPIDLVAVTLYPFEERAGSLDEPGAIEEIDIGGVALLRAAAKNFTDVIVVHHPARYAEVLAALREGGPTRAQRRGWALETFARTARYDAAIAADLARRAAKGEEALPAIHVEVLERVRGLRYGENPHQPAALYARAGARGALHPQREGKELSYNNLLDLHAATSMCSALDEPACVIVKHNEPCGAASAPSLAEAYQTALKGDEQSAFGGVVAFNRPLDPLTARALATQFVECVAAPEFAPEAEELLEQKKNLRLIRIAGEDLAAPVPWAVRLVGPWGLLQREETEPAPPWRCVTRRTPEQAESEALRFAWTVVTWARSNAVAIARGSGLIGLGSGQTSRVDAVDVALLKARRAGHDVRGAGLASDGFFPFADNIVHAAEAGVTAVVQPGGSVRDPEVIAACDERGIAMMFTDRRVFRH
ncbi:MAG: bifunctional phosphoribosylaminoimidazolecarboxamide formyltransferase/IMP cyclohydrolase [Candidatus Eisenbacteria bacterium]|uniref:Bifunctional purine biosynthesis protein PurH n=1 Tax=Eiseniibacteriota bacterium TaxID=2212470 RepID=A0A538TL80_UNCEI|nr:MAG: bifunctional phosphoribosylaminoimidazolecarboxamide formyltransferase/IMP cyclohydrolase [Candidatus Eisenbacteria bacterium]